MTAQTPDGPRAEVDPVSSEHPSLEAMFTDLAQLVAADERLLSGLARALQHAIQPAVDLSVVVGSPVAPRALASSSQRAQHLDALQMQAAEGPCQSAWETGGLVHTIDLGDDPRWPRFAELAREEALASVLALPLLADGRVVGVINGYSPQQEAFVGLDVGVAELAAFAVSEILRRQDTEDQLGELVDNLQQGLTSRSVIDAAKGVVMAHFGCDADTAFLMLGTASQQRNIKVRDLAREIVRNPQQVPTLDPPPGRS